MFFGNRIDLSDTEGVEIERCRLSNAIGLNANTNDILISENFIDGYIAVINNATNAQNALLKNNIIGSYRGHLKKSTIEDNTIYYSSNVILYRNQAWTIINNILDQRAGGGTFYEVLTNTEYTITHNIQVLPASNILLSPNSDVNNNVYNIDFNNIYIENNPWAATPIKDAGF